MTAFTSLARQVHLRIVDVPSTQSLLSGLSVSSLYDDQATSGSANTAGKNRVRARGVARGARIRRGRWMYECRIVRSAAAGLLLEARLKVALVIPPRG